MKRQLITLSLFFTGLCFVVAQVPLKWQRVYGEGLYNTCQGALQTETGHYILLQNQSSITGNTQLLMTCLDSLGVISWEKRIGDSALYWGSDIQQCTDKGFIITGHTYTNTEKSYDLLLIKTDSAGNIQWERQMGGSNWDFGQSVIITPDSAYLALGKTYSYGAGEADVYVLKLNFQGDTIWTRTFGGDSLDYGTSMDITADSCYLIAANTKSFGHGDLDAWIMKLNAEGDTLWSSFFGDTLEDCVNSLKCTPDKGFVFVGYTRSYGAQLTETWLMRFDSAHHYLWKMPEYWQIGPGEDVANSVALNDSAQFVISGYTTGTGLGRDIFITIMGDINIFKYSKSFGSLDDEEATVAFQTADKGYLMGGYTTGLGPANTNMYVIKTGPDALTEGSPSFTTGISEAPFASPEELLVYPNPCAGMLNVQLGASKNTETVQVLLYDLSGRMLKVPVSGDPSASTLFSLDLRSLESGMYFLEIRSGSERWVNSVILQK